MRVKRIAVLLVAALLCALLTGCGGGTSGTAPTEKELAGMQAIAGQAYAANQLEDVTKTMLANGRDTLFPAVKKAYKLPDGNYAFVSQPVAYSGPLTVVAVIDAASNQSVGIRIVEQAEHVEYVRDYDTASWFTDRFAGKDATRYLEVVKLDATAQDQIVAITGATVTAQAVVNGVNAVFGVYKEAVLELPADPVDYMVDGSAYGRDAHEK